MPLFGAHMSIAGGLHNALRSAQALQCDTVQLFTASPNRWGDSRRGRLLTDEDVRLFRAALRETKLRHATAHDSYLINLATPDSALYQQSIDAFRGEMDRAEALGLKYLVTHPGAATDGDDDAGLKQVARALDRVHRSCAGYAVRVLLETTAGQGRSLGHRFEHLGRILDLVKEPERVAVCVDTCHIFAAGYALASVEAYQATMDEFDRACGLGKIRFFHLNDSRKPLGSRVDRHAHIGRGCIGSEGFRLLLNDPRFARHPMVLETPKEDDDGAAMDPVNLQALRGLVVEGPRKATAARNSRSGP